MTALSSALQAAAVWTMEVVHWIDSERKRVSAPISTTTTYSSAICFPHRNSEAPGDPAQGTGNPEGQPRGAARARSLVLSVHCVRLAACVGQGCSQILEKQGYPHRVNYHTCIAPTDRRRHCFERLTAVRTPTRQKHNRYNDLSTSLMAGYCDIPP